VTGRIGGLGKRVGDDREKDGRRKEARNGRTKKTEILGITPENNKN